MNLFNSIVPFRAGDAPVYDCRENCYLRFYENVTESEINVWLTEIEADGFSKLFTNNLYGNLFYTLKKDNLTLTAFYTPCDASLRVTAQKNAVLPRFEKPLTEKLCETAFYCFENDHSMIDCGMCLLIQCSDYSFFVVDSGHYFQVNDNDRIHKFMRERTPSGQKIVISGWLITHAHSDHISKLFDFLRYNCDDVIIEGFYSNLLSENYPGEDWNMEELLLAKKLFNTLDKHPADKIKLHSGQRFYIRNLEIDVLLTHEDIYPQRITDFNDCSCVVTVKAENTKIFIPGDASSLASVKLENLYGENLKCDIAQISHHGHSGLSARLYEMLGAEVAVFPVTRIKFDEEYPVQEANRRAVELADEYFISSDGTVKISLPYQKGSAVQLPDESFEDFEKIKRLWGYTYTPERKNELWELFIKNGGSLNETFLPCDKEGFIETTKWLEYLK